MDIKSPEKSTDKLKVCYEASMVLSGAGDALGYKNGEWEFCHSGRKIHDELEHMGGIENVKVKLPRWKVSDDTVMHLATAEALNEWGHDTDKEKLYHNLAKNYKKCMGDMIGRAPDNATLVAHKEAAFQHLTFRSAEACLLEKDPHHQWVSQASGHESWRSRAHWATATFEQNRWASLVEKQWQRQKREPLADPTTTQTFPFRLCGRLCLSHTGLISHQHTCNRSGHPHFKMFASEVKPTLTSHV